MRVKPHRNLTVALALLLVGAAGGAADAEAPSGRICGTVQDAQGGAVPGVTLTLTDEADDSRRAGVTGAEGTFCFPVLAPGSYKIDAELAGFGQASYPGISVGAGRVDIQIALPSNADKP